MDGILLVDKPSGWTSHDVVNKVRGTFRIPKVGHGGTLDPLATGLLVLLLGKATKLSDSVMSGDKGYEGTILLGRVTASQDTDGETLSEADASHVLRESLEAELNALKGESLQMPPMVSAIKINGQKLYEMARKGIEVERQPRLIRIDEIKLLSFEPPSARFEVQCGKGTYVRTIAHDVGQKLGCGGCLSGLRRVRSGNFSIDQAYPLAHILTLAPEELQKIIVGIDKP